MYSLYVLNIYSRIVGSESTNNSLQEFLLSIIFYIYSLFFIISFLIVLELPEDIREKVAQKLIEESITTEKILHRMTFDMWQLMGFNLGEALACEAALE
jgi:ABC-type protease/lipase transport system fused ATPase/permease subunit